MPRFWPVSRGGPRPRTWRFSYEKAGICVRDQPVPWNADVVQVELAVKLPTGLERRRGDFRLQMGNGDWVAPESFRRDTDENMFLIGFRFPPPRQSADLEISWRSNRLATMSLPHLSREEFSHNLRLEQPTVFARIGEHSVVCQTYVANQCRGFTATALLVSPTSLLPCRDLGPRLEIRGDGAELVQSLPVTLTASQLAARQAIIALVPRRLPRRIVAWQFIWMLGDRPLAAGRVRGISLGQFERSLRVDDGRFMIQPRHGGPMKLSRRLPDRSEIKSALPSFVVSSR